MIERTTQPQEAETSSNENDLRLNATTRALLLPEILSAILLKLGYQDILTKCFRVSQFWKSTIDTSPEIQKKLDFMPEITQVSKGQGENELAPRVSHALKKIACESKGLQDAYERLDQKFRLNWDFVQEASVFGYPNATWRNMLFAQPPLPVHYKIYDGLGLGIEDQPSHLHQYGEDVKLGEIYGDWKKGRDRTRPCLIFVKFEKPHSGRHLVLASFVPCSCCGCTK